MDDKERGIGVTHREHISRSAEEKISQPVLGKKSVWRATLAEAQAANVHEHSLSVRQTLGAYPWAVVWSLTISILFGKLSGGSYQIPAKWQSSMGSGPQAGAIVEALDNGFLIQRFGYLLAFILGLVFMISFVFVSFFRMSVQLQTVGQILCGIPWGIFATIGPAYASELCPLPLRPYLTAYMNMCVATGQLVGARVLQSLLNRPDQWAWRFPFAIQWL
ncbi:hypothetical protein F5884DRAFT_870767 [Xylogone sp. PMI_703]|nr:hypothetical protein F5884DRAFT_870767 [Xylogone sp. PMI_703]